MESGKALISLNLEAMVDLPKGQEPRFGKFSGHDGLASYASELVGKNVKYDWHSLYTNRFVGAFHEFDRARVIEKARSR